MKKKGFIILTIFGSSDKKGGEGYLIKMRQNGLLISPAMVMDENIVRGIFYSHNEIESPIYIYADNAFKILEIFYSGLLKKEGLNKWLKRILQ